MRRLGLLAALVGLVGIGLGAYPVRAGVDCTVPGSHVSIQVAVDDLNCDNVILANQTYNESVLIQRSMSITGPAGVADIAGLVEARGTATSVQLTNLKIVNDCWPGAMVSSRGGQISTSGVEAVSSPGGSCPRTAIVFEDGLESNDTSAWTLTVD